MEVGDKFTHKYSPSITCEITGFTDKGYKVQQTEGKKKPKQAFFNKADFEVKNGFWVKQAIVAVIALKYPTLKAFAEKLESLEKVQLMGIISIEVEGKSYYFNPDFQLDGIHVQIKYIKTLFDSCMVSIAGGKNKYFKKSEKYVHVLDMVLEWIYPNYFQYGEDELTAYRVFYKGFHSPKVIKYPHHYEHLGYYVAQNYEELQVQLVEIGMNLDTVLIEKAHYSFPFMQQKLMNVAL